ncbi:DUF5466 domain-containing protein [Citrobacter farmeri]|nr:DUF5466 domain-containing protein [Citrobacter farmeri]MBU5645824.1 DUF5466 domain-containing protein [Pluralibacter sp. S54_ASV_43]HAT3753853.1 hypothetical protein [Citrobacter amalonaticus]EKU0080677.1 DUF5466 domain-containing protein [Citrobacter farmeri]EKX4539327.1 DUF5466 domain-containing protein [Citrobacter farmeri]
MRRNSNRESKRLRACVTSVFICRVLLDFLRHGSFL